MKTLLVLTLACYIQQLSLLAHTEVGSLPGEVFVDNAGRANYSIPITLPPGTGGMVPALSLNYNSAGPNGPLGVGWSLGGLSSITRVASNFFYDNVASGVMMTPETDRLALDGQRMVLTSGYSYWTAGATFRTAQETFNKIVSTGTLGNGPAGFVLKSKSGLTSYYGQACGLDNNAIVLLQADADNDGEADSGESQIFTWLVSKIEDTAGNYMTYYYRSVNNVSYVSRIEYTGHEKINATDGDAAITPYNQIRFIYSDKNAAEIQSSYFSGNTLLQGQRLSEIQVWTNTMSGSDTGGELVYKYTLNYRSTIPTGNNSLTGRSTLESVVFTSVQDGQSHELNATVFEWEDRVGTLSQQYSSVIDTSLSMNWPIDKTFFADLDGDGKQEIVVVDNTRSPVLTKPRASPTSVTCYRILDNGSIQKISSIWLPGLGCYDLASTVGDVDDDGSDEIVLCADSKTLYVYKLNNGVLCLSCSHSVVGINIDTDYQVSMLCTDFDYDGTTEVGIVYGYTTENVKFFIFDNLCNGNFSWRKVYADFDIDIDVPDVRPTDINGDGIFDLLVFPNNQAGEARVRIGAITSTIVNGRPSRELSSLTGNDNYKIGIAESLNSISASLPKGRYLTGDFNQDGYTDFAVIDYVSVNGVNKFRVKRYLNMNYVRKKEGVTFFMFRCGGTCTTGITWNSDYDASLDDVSGDGKPDLCLAVKNSSGDVDVYVLKAISSCYGFDTSSVYFSRSTGKNWNDTHSHLTATDYDGDGVQDLVFCHNDYSGDRPCWIAFHGLGVQGDMMTSVTNGFGVSTEITYSNLIDSSVYWKESSTPFPVVTKTVPITVVKTVTRPDGAGGSYRSEYAYSDARFHLQGLGFLGFESMVVYDPQVRVYEWKHLEHTYPLMGMVARDEKWYVPENVTAPSNSDPISSTHWLLSRISNTNIFDKVTGGTLFSMAVRSVDEKWEMDNAINGDGGLSYKSTCPYIKTTSKTWFDNQNQADVATLPVVTVTGPLHADYVAECPGRITYGNIEKTLVSHAIYDTENGTLLDTVSDMTENDYAAVDTTQWLLGRLLYSKSTATSTAGTEIKTAAFAYDAATGLIVAEVEEPSSTGVASLLAGTLDDDYQSLLGASYESKLTVYSRNGYGNILTEQVQFRDIDVDSLSDPTINIPESAIVAYDIKTNVYHPDDKGRYARQVKNIQNDTETFVYDPKTGAVLEQTGPNGTTTKWQYDAFGRVIREDRADGTWSTIFREWYSTALLGHDMGSRVCYKETTQATAASTSIVYYDSMQRQLRSSVESAVSGTWIYKDSVYNAKGQVVKASDNYFSTGTPIWTTTGYDKLGRLQMVTAPDGTKTFTQYLGLTQRNVSNYDDGVYSASSPQVDQVTTTLTDVRGDPRVVTNTLGKQLTHSYSPAGRLVSTSTTGAHASGRSRTHTVQLTYDMRGNKIKMVDPDMGNWYYATNALGQLRWQKDAKGNVTKLYYDNLGRLIRKTNLDGVAEWEYYDRSDAGTGAWIGALHYERLHRTDAASGVYFSQKSYYYDDKGRNYLVLTGVDGNWSYSYSRFDSLGRLHRIDHFWRPKGIISTTSKIWHSFGTIYSYVPSKSYVTAVRDSTGYLWWSASASDYDAWGRVTKYNYGNGAQTTLGYESLRPTVLTDIAVKLNAGLGSAISGSRVSADALGNITYRRDTVRAKTETFTYDGLNRLTSSSIIEGNSGNRVAENYGYDDFGNITTRTGIGSYAYGTARTHAVTSAGSHSYSYDANGNATLRDGTSLTWNASNLPVLLGNGMPWSRFLYDAAGDRVIQVSREDATTNSVTKKLYLGAIEQEWTATAPDANLHNDWRDWTYTLKQTRVYISTPSGVIGSLTHRPDATNAYDALNRNYFHFDHLGSICAVTSASGAVIENLSYDVWGQRRDPSSWVVSSIPITDAETATDRGFTGHEMLDHLGLVHMNARIYDPTIGRFLSPDSVLQFPNNIQSYDRYQYCLNNPCTFTDPSGHILPIIVGIIVKLTIDNVILQIAIMAVTGAAWAAMNGAEGADIWKAGMMAAAMVAVSYGIGKLFGDVQALINDGAINGMEVARAAAHGISGGIAEQINGGDFGAGFASSFVGSAAGSAMQSGAMGRFFEGKDASAVFKRTTAAAIIGGTTAEIGGGKFANGAMTAAIQHLFNHEGGHRVKKGAVVWIANNQDGDAEIEGFLRDETDKLARDLNADLSFFAIHNDEEFARFNQISSRYDKVWVVMHGSLSYTRGNWSGGNAFVYERKFGRFGKSLKTVGGDVYGRTPTAQEIGINLKSSYAFGGVFGCNPIDTMTNSTPIFEVWEGKGVYQGVYIGIKHKITSFFNTGD